MKPEIKQKWIDALRSGKYNQCHGGLSRTSNGALLYCAIGVLVEVFRLETGVGRWSQYDGDLNNQDRTFISPDGRGGQDARRGSAPPALYLWTGVENAMRTVFQLVSKMNDEGASFSEIANFLEGVP